MRVVGGSLGGRELRAPRGLATRPSSDRLRQTLFDLLGGDLTGKSFADVFAGTGAVGIEAYSRGARPVAWIESAPRAVQALRANLAALGLGGTRDLTVVAQPARAGLCRLATPSAAVRSGWDVIFLDPPYDESELLTATLAALEAGPGLLHATTSVIAETRRSAAVPSGLRRLRLARRHEVGDSSLMIFTLASSPRPDGEAGTATTRL